MSETEIAGVKYRFGKMASRTQFHVARRLGPIYGAIAENISAVGASQGLSALLPMVDVLADLPDEPLDYVLDNCLSVVERQTGAGSWAKVAASNGGLMFEDIDMKVMLQLAWGVIQQDFAGFFPGKDSGSPPQDQPAQG